MENVQNIYTTKEVADMFNISASHLLRVSKELLKDNTFTDNDMRQSGKRIYLFNNKAIEKLRIKFKK